MAQTLDPLEEALDLPVVESPYEGTQLTVPTHLAISAFWFATNFLWGALLTIMLPDEVKILAPYYRVLALPLLLGISSIVALVVPLVVGALSDRCASPMGRRRPFIIWGVTITVLGLGLMALTLATQQPYLVKPLKDEATLTSILNLGHSPALLLFLAAFMIVQLGNNMATGAYSGIIPDLIPPDHQGAASGYMALMSQVGTLLGVLSSSLFFASSSEPVKYIMVCVVLIGVSLVTVLGVRETPLPSAPPKIVWSKYLASLWIDPRKYPDFAWVWITRALVMLGFYAILPFINYYLTDVIHIEKPSEQAGLLTGVILLFSSISGVAGGYISDRFGRLPVVYAANASLAVMVIAFIFCRNFGEVMLAGVLFGLGYGAYISVDWALGTAVLPTKKNAAKEMAVWHVAMTLPQAIASPIAGFAIASFGMTVQRGPDGNELVHYTLKGYATVFIMSAVCFAVGARLLKNVKSVH